MASYQDIVLADEPVAYWAMDEDTGTILYDDSGNAYNATLGGGYTLDASGLLINSAAGCVQFNGSTGYATIPQRNAFACMSQNGIFSVEVCTALTDYTLAESNLLVGNTAVSSQTGFAVYHDNRVDQKAIKLTIYRSQTGNYVLDSLWANVLLDNNPHHFLFVGNGVSCTCYVDGVAQSPVNFGIFTTNNPSADLRIGADISFSHPARARIGPIAFFDKQLTPQQIQQHYKYARVLLVTMTGQCLFNGSAADIVTVDDASTHQLIETAVPDVDGNWSADVLPGDYYVAAFKDGCAPRSHGPYTVS